MYEIFRFCILLFHHVMLPCDNMVEWVGDKSLRSPNVSFDENLEMNFGTCWLFRKCVFILIFHYTTIVQVNPLKKILDWSWWVLLTESRIAFWNPNTCCMFSLVTLEIFCNLDIWNTWLKSIWRRITWEIGYEWLLTAKNPMNWGTSRSTMRMKKKMKPMSKLSPTALTDFYCQLIML